jgi:hypothetical protein
LVVVGPTHDEFRTVDMVVNTVDGAVVGPGVHSGLNRIPVELRQRNLFAASKAALNHEAKVLRAVHLLRDLTH